MSFPINECWNAATSPRGVLITPLVPGAVYLTLEDLERLLLAVKAEIVRAYTAPPGVCGDPVPDGVPQHGFGVEREAA